MPEVAGVLDAFSGLLRVLALGLLLYPAALIGSFHFTWFAAMAD
jgi:hypothetical protein